MVIQFAFVTLFAPVFPMAAFIALANNLIEMRSDSFKLYNKQGFQRPLARGGSTVQLWENVIAFVSTLSVIINIGIIAANSHVLTRLLPGATKAERVVIAGGFYFLLSVLESTSLYYCAIDSTHTLLLRSKCVWATQGRPSPSHP